jgi:hypothetical protein
MKVYELGADSDHFESLLMTAGDLFEFANRFNGKPMKRPWTDVTIGKDPRRLPKGDFPSLIPGVTVFSQKAVTALRDLLEKNGQILPVSIAGEGYFLYNVTRIVDALDETDSSMDRFDDGRVFYIDDHSFFPHKLAGLSIFKIPQMPDGSVFVTDVFVERVQSAGLKGFWLPVVWSRD